MPHHNNKGMRLQCYVCGVRRGMHKNKAQSIMICYRCGTQVDFIAKREKTTYDEAIIKYSLIVLKTEIRRRRKRGNACTPTIS